MWLPLGPVGDGSVQGKAGWDSVSGIDSHLFETETHHVAQAGVGLESPLPLPFKCKV